MRRRRKMGWLRPRTTLLNLLLLLFFSVLLLVLSWRARTWLFLHHHHGGWHSAAEIKWKRVHPRAKEAAHHSHHQDRVFRERKMMPNLLDASLSSPFLQGDSKQPGSRPPQCHNECPFCTGECLARPMYISGGSGFSQHAIWGCTCVF
ncbi:hypothetical protein KP509_09G027700 [Ceratopteris richardii]|uniref:Uncharacterized protein n=1 Tax=Ceratopteris richardii TaxID=49495 RepID=A0A8T2U199_CERRI|nr:hypothetical protein KP509_09G027700 [Ceratopteris richardii]